MAMEDRIHRIEEMEAHLNQSQANIAVLQQALSLFQEGQKDYQTLINYYGSNQWFEDIELDEKNAFPNELRRGVLSQDAIYNCMSDNRQLAIELLEVATKILKA